MVSRGVSANWPMKAKVHSAIGHDLRPVGFLAGLEEGVDIGHEASCRVAGIVGQRVDLFRRYADVVQPLAGRPPHRCSPAWPSLHNCLPGWYSGAYSHTSTMFLSWALNWGWRLMVQERYQLSVLSLTVTMPPVVTLPARGSRLQMFMNMLDDLLVGGGHGGAHPVGGIHIGAEFLRIAVLTVLCLRGNGLPHIPRLASSRSSRRTGPGHESGRHSRRYRCSSRW